MNKEYYSIYLDSGDPEYYHILYNGVVIGELTINSSDKIYSPKIIDKVHEFFLSKQVNFDKVLFIKWNDYFKF